MQNHRATLEEQEAYWKRMFAGELPILQIWSDYPRPVVSSFIRATESIALEPEVLKRIQTFSAAANVSSFVVLLGRMTLSWVHRLPAASAPGTEKMNTSPISWLCAPTWPMIHRLALY
jgi:hypothetical protein